MAKRSRLEWVKNKLGFEGLITVDPVGKSGGLALMWKEKDQAELLGLSQHHIDVKVRITDMNDWRLTGIYGEPDRSKRRDTWDLIRNLARDANLPWCMVGDLNNVVSANDKRGGEPYPEWLIDGFNEAIHDANLVDIELSGHQFTWEHGRGTEEWMEVRLDRALTTENWLNNFPMAKLYNLEGAPSDHSAILLIPQVKKSRAKVYRFRFENAWLTEPMCEQLVREGWMEGQEYNVQEKIKRCSDKLATWGKEITGNFAGRIKDCKAELKRYRNGRDTGSKEKYDEARTKLDSIFNQREIFWRQRSKQLWLQAGDKNSKYFHKTASRRRRNNHIQKLQDDNGNWLDWDHGLPELIMNYFNTLFAATESDWQAVVEGVPSTITNAQNEELLRPVIEEKVKEALFQMNPDKAPGPDGMTPAFFQKHWKIVGKDVVKVVQEFFINGTLNSDLNATNIVLIPKKKCPVLMNDLRPISLCNVLVKIITKVAANRLKKTLESVISENQSAFMTGRLISDNVMISYEVMHYLKRKRRGKEGHMAIKLDMSKAYDRIEWGFLRAMLNKMGYNDWWVHLILTCVSTVSYNITQQNKDIGPIFPSRGIRQGDPLSPYLFIICAQGLSALIKQYEQNRWMQGIRVCNGAPSITHMLFADDSYVYCKANESEVDYVLTLLRVFERASGQKVNLNKSVVFFSSNIIESKRVQLCHRLSMEEAGADCKYLGLPNMMQRSKVATLGFLRGKVKKRVLAWDGALISQGGKEILVKSVAQTLPTYAMSVFLLPEEIHRDIERSISKFWWNSRTGDRKGIHWMSWDRLSRHKSVGGMGFRNFKDFNLALLGKQGWRFLTKPLSLVSRVYKARYFPTVNFLEAKIGHNPSYIWRSILEAKELVASGARWKVGTGEDINILRQPWLSDSERPYIESDSIALENNKISSLMHVNQRSWDEEILSDLFTERDQECIKKIKIGEYGERDELFWSQERHGCYSVRSAYRLLQVQKSYWRMSDNNSFWNKIWRIKAPAKILNLVWRSLSYCLPTMVMLQQKGVDVESRCPVCKWEPETIDHVFLHCSVAVQCWQIIIPNVQCPGGTLTQWWESVLANCDINKKAEVAAVCWSLWKARNEVVWNNKFTRLYVIVANAKQYLEQWRYAQSKISYSLFPQTVEGDGGVSWARPQELTIKVSVDAAIFSEFNASGIGLVARDSTWEMIMATTVRLNEVLDPDMVEVMAIKEALSWTKNTTWQNIIVESDCLVAVQAIRSKVPMISLFGLIVEECRRMLQDQNTVSLSFIKRSANMVAHELARASYSFPDRYFDRSSVPIDVDVALKADLS